MHVDSGEITIPSMHEIDKTKANLFQAVNLLCEESLSGIHANLLNSIAIYNGVAEMPTSASALFCQGRIYVKNVGDEFPLFYYLDMLVHEIAHQHFNIIYSMTHLIADNNQTFKSYANNKQRPIYGILHGAFVLYRLIEFYLSSYDLLGQFSMPYAQQDYNNYLHARFFQIPCNYDFRLEIYKQKFRKTLEQLVDARGLTLKGKEFIKYIMAHDRELLTKLKNSK